MKAIQMTEQGGPEVLKLVDLPDPVPGPGQVVVRVASASVNFSDVLRRRGDVYPVPTSTPFVPGGEVAGTVTSVGDGVESPTPGTRVFGLIGEDGSGGYAELALGYAANMVPIPDGLDVDAAAGIVVAGLAATVMLHDIAQVADGDTVFVPAAAGGVGSFAVQIAKLLGAGIVIAGASTDAKRQVALGYGADHAIDYTAAGWTDEVRKLTDGRGVDVALEMTSPAHLGETLSILAPFGRLINYGAVSGSVDGLDPALLQPLLYDPAPSQALIGFNVGVWFAERPAQAIASLQRVIGWVASGQISTPQVQTLPLAQAAEAHRLLETGATTGKLVLKP